MMYDLNTFYRCKDWRRLLDVIKSERLDDEGQVVCAYCGKPIVRAYDIIGHHKIELTQENVNDVTISLNPDNVELVHHKCHNYIHNKLGYGVREVYLVYGAPLSGKSTWVNDNMCEGDIVVDMDSIWQCISNCDRYIKPNRLRSVVFRIRDTLLDTVRYRYGKWNNAYIIGGYPLISERERLCNELGAREVFVDISKEECLQRLEVCEDGRDKAEWKGYIEEWFERYTPHALQ